MRFFFLCFLAATTQWVGATNFLLPTANREIFAAGSEDKFYVGTVGKSWESGTFGCVRSGGWQLHEGLDIRSVKRDSKGEPIDHVVSTAAGVVVYANRKPSLSNYGNYVVIQHVIHGIEVYSLYAHLREIRADLKPGLKVKAGEVIAMLGRSTNTREGISKERAHVHFELNCFVNERFSAWYKKTYPGQRDDHAEWNGQNLIGLDPSAILQAERTNKNFNLASWIQNQTELCRVFVRDTQFPWLDRYPALVRPNPTAQKEGVAGYELVLNFSGLPCQIIPRAASEVKGSAKFQLLSVNETEYRKNPCRKLVTNKNGKWELASNGIRLLDLITF